MTDREHQIRERAYSIWEAEGHPHGRADDHWHRAAHEVAETGADAAPADAPTNGDGARAEMNGASAEPEDAEPATAAPKPARRRRTAAATGSMPKKRAVKKT
jgi:hypothetical protein